MKFEYTKKIGMILLAIWLVLNGLILFFPAIAKMNQILSLLAIAAGVFIFLDRSAEDQHPTN
jgi:FtsH-binding integral membrane protein